RWEAVSGRAVEGRRSAPSQSEERYFTFFLQKRLTCHSFILETTTRHFKMKEKTTEGFKKRFYALTCNHFIGLTQSGCVFFK
uniref:Uncharacterized protein n=1 Tax=Astyanax mexicanus TaxID=7994 RepID=A0A3B1IQG7_ASTMX